LLDYLKSQGISALFHYLPLHSSIYYLDKHDGRRLPNTDRFSETIVRLPFYNSLKKHQVKSIVQTITTFFTTP
jgi:dTDP-4-amino-4,6-dideoxygalactose transaminase